MPTQKELSDLREAYLLRREAALENKVSKLGIKLYDKIFEQYLIALEQTPAGTLKYTQTNLNLIQGLDRVYSLFNQVDNIPVINGFLGDLSGITPLNVKYFNNIQKSGVRAEAAVVDAVVQKRLGIAGGQPVKGGFADKFINDKTLLKKIKKQTTQAVTKGQSFQTFRQELKATIQGTGAKEPGGLQQYYRNYAYDTYQKVDRLNQDLFAKELGLRYFIWAGGITKTSRPLCVMANGKVIDKVTYSKLKFSDIKTSKYKNGSGKLMPLNSGLDDTWNPMNDLGQYGCRHTKNYITDAVARQLQDRWLKTSALT
mgnify:CR=1 FL=1